MSDECCYGQQAEQECKAGPPRGHGSDHWKENPDGSWEHWIEDPPGNDIRHIKWKPGVPLTGKLHVNVPGVIFTATGEWDVTWEFLWDGPPPTLNSLQRYTCEHLGTPKITVIIDRDAEQDVVSVTTRDLTTVTDERTVAEEGGVAVTDTETVEVSDERRVRTTFRHDPNGLPFNGNPDDPDRAFDS